MSSVEHMMNNLNSVDHRAGRFLRRRCPRGWIHTTINQRGWTEREVVDNCCGHQKKGRGTEGADKRRGERSQNKKTSTAKPGLLRCRRRMHLNINQPMRCGWTGREPRVVIASAVASGPSKGAKRDDKSSELGGRLREGPEEGEADCLAARPRSQPSVAADQ